MTLSVKRLPHIGILFSQFAPYHVDRCQAVARRFDGRAEVIGIEVATASATYAWAPSGNVDGATKRTLFPGQDYDAIRPHRRFWRQARAVRDCDIVLVGISYAAPDIALLAPWLALCGKHVILMTDSKFDDMPRRIGKEWIKSVGLRPYAASIVAGTRQMAYLAFLGLGRRPIATGYDTVDLNRVRALGGAQAPEGVPFADRPFVFVGRFVTKKNVASLIDAYARYRALMGERHLRLIGSGPLEPEIRAQIARLGLGDYVEIAGFLQAEGVAKALAGALALVLPSSEEQWGLVVNEAMAFCLPIIVSENVGARDLLVRNLVNGFVVDPRATESLARAMLALSDDEALWRRMVEESRKLAPYAHVDRFADAVETVLGATLPARFPKASDGEIVTT